MKKITVKVEGMRCGMCESHVNDLVRRNFNVKKVTSSHIKGETVILAPANHRSGAAYRGYFGGRI